MKLLLLALGSSAGLLARAHSGSGAGGGCQREPGADVVEVPLPTVGTIEFEGDLGDGFEPLPLGRRVFNIWHHNLSKVQCSEMVRRAGVDKSQVCAGYGTQRAPGYELRVGGEVPRTSNANVGYIDATANRIIYPAALQGQSGFVCLEAPPDGQPSLCPASNRSSFTLDGFIQVESTGNNIGWGSPDYEKERLYAVDWLAPRVYCLDVSDPADLRPCKGYPYSGHGFGTLRASVMPKTGRAILTGYRIAACMDTSTEAPSPCAGWPSNISTTGNLVGEPIPVLDGDGVALGFCQYAEADSVKCYHIANGSVAEQGTELAVAGLKFQSVNLQNVSNAPHKNEFSRVSVFQTRTYYAVGAFDTQQGLICYDGKARDFCANFPHAVSVKGGIYGVVADAAVNGECVWSLGHRGILSSFSAADPSQPCSSDTSVVQVVPDCAAMEWRALQLSNASFKYFDAVQVTVMNAEGAEVRSGNLTSGTALSLLGLPVSGATAALTVRMEFDDRFKQLVGRSGDSEALPQLTAEWEGCSSHCVSSSATTTMSAPMLTTTATTTTTCELQRLEDSLKNKKNHRAGPAHDHLREKLADHMRWQPSTALKDVMRKAAEVDDARSPAAGSLGTDAGRAGFPLVALFLSAGLIFAVAVWARALRRHRWAGATSAQEAQDSEVLLNDCIE